MRSSNSSSGSGSWAFVATLAAASLWLGIPSDATAQTEKTRFSSAADWNLRAENLGPVGVNPNYQPLLPGNMVVMEEPNFSDDGDEGYYRKTIQVLEQTEKFDLPHLGGKFECAVVEEKEYLDGKQFTKSHNWYCFDKTTSSIYVFGEIAWESASRESADMSDTVSESWRVGEPDTHGITEPGLISPGTFFVGSKYIIDGAEGLAFVGGENMESGLTMTVPAGTFYNCNRTREYDLMDPEDVTDKWWCPGVGLVKDTSDGEIVEADALSHPKMAMIRAAAKSLPKADASSVARIPEAKAKELALAAVPGEVTDLGIERKMGGNRYVVEILAAADGVETDVILDMETGEVLGTEK